MELNGPLNHDALHMQNLEGRVLLLLLLFFFFGGGGGGGRKLPALPVYWS